MIDIYLNNSADNGKTAKVYTLFITAYKTTW